MFEGTDSRPYSKSSLTLKLNEWKFNLSFSRVSVRFLYSWRASVIPYYATSRLLTLQLLRKSTDTQDKLRLNFHSLSVSEPLEYGRQC